MAKKVSKKKTTSRRSTAKGKAATKTNGWAAAVAGTESAWKQNRGVAQRSEGYPEPPDIPDDEYVVQLVTARASQIRNGKNKGKPIVSFSFVIVYGDYADETVRESYLISGEEMGQSGKTFIQVFLGAIQSMGIDTSKRSRPSTLTTTGTALFSFRKSTEISTE